MKLLSKIILTICIIIPYSQSTLAFSLDIPNSKIKKVQDTIQKNISVNCLGKKSYFKCMTIDNSTHGMCFIQTMIDENSPNKISCSIEDTNNGKTLNTIILETEKLITLYNRVRQIEKKQKIFSISESFFKKHLQKYTYSCEVSSTADILSTIKNKNITEEELINQLDKDWFGQPAYTGKDTTIWGNPNKGFVGYIDKDNEGNDASQRNKTGYGVYEQPIANLYKTYGIQTTIINQNHHSLVYGPQEHLQDLLSTIEKGNYVQFWGDVCTDPTYDDGEVNLYEVTQEDIDAGKNGKNNCWSWGTDRSLSWYYKEGSTFKKHETIIGEHNFYLLGYKGEKQNPSHIIFWDTATGEHMYPIQEFMRKWAAMKYKSIIVYK